MRLVLLLQTCSKNRILQYFIRNLITKQGFESKNGLFVMAVRYCLTLNAFVNFSSKDKPILKSGAILLSKDLLIHLEPNNMFFVYCVIQSINQSALFSMKGLYEN